MTPFKVSSGYLQLIDLFCSCLQQGKDLPGDITLQTADGFKLGVSLGNALPDVGLGFRIRSQAANGDDVQGTVRGPVTAPVEAMAADLA